ncbi:MAG: transcriptional repressor [Sphingomonadaceae bacterium]|nr:transcriptional repressor [Sphingomonadaceae bacterium]
MAATHAHDHRLPTGPELIEAARAAVEAAGEQWTAMRAAVFDALAGHGRPVSAYDIAEDVSKREGRRVAANSVYRILDLFVATNVAQRIESANAYVPNAHPGCVHDCIFLVCDACGRIAHVDDDSIAKNVRSVARHSGFTAARPVIEVHGTCANCTQ